NLLLRDMRELYMDRDSINREIMKQRLAYYQNRLSYFRYFNKDDSVVLPPDVYAFKQWNDSVTQAKYRAQYQRPPDTSATASATSRPDSLATTDTAVVRDTSPSESAARKTALAVAAKNRTPARPAPNTPAKEKTD